MPTSTFNNNAGGHSLPAGGWTQVGAGPPLVSADAVYLFASLSPAATSTQLLALCGGAGALPFRSIVVGIQVNIVRSSDVAFTIRDAVVKLAFSGAALGTDHAQATSWTTSNQSALYGSSSDTWGTTLDENTINNSTFGVYIQARNIGSVAAQSRVTQVQVTITYTTRSKVRMVLAQIVAPVSHRLRDFLARPRVRRSVLTGVLVPA